MIKGPSNLNWATLVAAAVGLFAYLCPNMPSDVRWDILLLAYAFHLAVVPLIHNFVNHNLTLLSNPPLDSQKK